MTYVYLDDSIFKNDVNKINVTTCIFQIFSIKKRKIRASAFIDDGDDFLNSIQHIIACDSIKIVGNSKNSRGYIKVLFEFSGSDIGEIIDKAVLHDVTVEGEFFGDDYQNLLQFVVNDHDGTCIVFDHEYFDETEIKQQLQQMKI